MYCRANNDVYSIKLGLHICLYLHGSVDVVLEENEIETRKIDLTYLEEGHSVSLISLISLKSDVRNTNTDFFSES